ncbi:DMT family transporter [Streptomyces montanisoli]|uniref:DMT family transporter n=1 Tax=Streptomyces montanisoli TaxID=2798581 RepID=A0A940MGW8_9ACTN|nr:DMT family transporter [Streptomyces montanisoli]MBP0460862.1 DMT family transporter [Streptomyces montanisoli]
MSAFSAAVLLSLVSAVAYAAGAFLQERVASRGHGGSWVPLRSGLWWAAVLLNGSGALLHVAALACGPLSLVQPLGALTIVFALPMAAMFGGRAAGRGAWRGAVLATAGLAGLLALTRGADAQVLDGSQRLALALVSFGLVGVLCVASALVGGRASRSVLLAAAGGVAFGVSSVFVKAVADGWSATGLGVRLPSLAAVAVLAVAGLLLSQASYRGAGLAVPLAVVTVVNPVVAAAVGLTVFGEGFRYGAAGAFAALAFGLVSVAGLVLITSGPPAVRTPSDGDAVRPEVGERVDVAAVGGPRAHLEVEMRPRHVAGRP